MNPSPQLLLYFENTVGRILEHPDGYAVVQYYPGERQLDHLQAFLMHTGRLLLQRGWHKLVGDQRQMTPFTEEEGHWIVEYWLGKNEQRPDLVYGAVVLAPADYALLTDEQRQGVATVAALTYRLFDDPAVAVEWLTEQP